MNKFYSVIFALLLSSSAFGQCTVDFDFGDVGFGISPDPALGETLEPGVVNLEYLEVIHILIPAFASDVDPTYPPTLPIDSLSLDGVVLTDTVTLEEYSPEELGLEVICNNQGDSNYPCSFLGATQYCVSLEGVPNTAAVYKIDLNVTGWLTIFEPFSTPFVFSDFILISKISNVNSPIFPLSLIISGNIINISYLSWFNLFTSNSTIISLSSFPNNLSFKLNFVFGCSSLMYCSTKLSLSINMPSDQGSNPRSALISQFLTIYPISYFG